MPKGNDLYGVSSAAVHHAVGRHDEFAHVFTPKLRHHAARVGVGGERPYAAKHALEPGKRGGRVIGGDVGDGVIDLRVGQR